MKRYMLFGGNKYYAKGGACDIVSSTNNVGHLLDLISYIESRKERKEVSFDPPHPINKPETGRMIVEEKTEIGLQWYCRNKKIDWWHIYDSHTNEIVYGSQDQAFGADDLNDEVIENTVCHEAIKEREN